MTAPPAERRPARRPDASMDLLRQISEQPMDPDYEVVAARREPTPRGKRRWALGLVAVVAGAMFAVAAVQNTQRAPLVASERQELIARIQATQRGLGDQRAQVAELDAEITRLRTAAARGDNQAEARLSEITEVGASVGTVAVTGPGVVVTVDDAPGSDTDTRDQVLDLDLQILVNGLWQSGAEAISVNGHRLSSLTAIRSAGQAITVDYTSLTRPYRVEAIGDSRTMPATFTQTDAGAWWNDLSRNRGMSFAMSGVDELTLGADPGMVLRYAQEMR